MPFTWSDGTTITEGNFPESVLQSPLDHTLCTEFNQCERINSSSSYKFLQRNRTGQCAAGKKLAGVQDFSVNYVDCDVYQNVAVFCEHPQTQNHIETFSFHNNLSDVIVSTSTSGFYKLLFSPENPVCPENWMRFSNRCIQLSNSTCANLPCDPKYPQYRYCNAGRVFKPPILKNDLTTQNSNNESLHKIKQNPTRNYDALFQLLGHLRLERFSNLDSYTAVVSDIDNLCERHMKSCSIVVGKIKLVSTKWDIRQKPHLVLCEIDLTKDNSNLTQSNCSERIHPNPFIVRALTMTCLDGTCIHFSLVCDGHRHCVDGEDEKNCPTGICSDPDINCHKDCHPMNVCNCAIGYFQCLSGGCISEHLLCDRVPHCEDESDEARTCFYYTPSYERDTPFPTEILNYVNRRIKMHKESKEQCVYGLDDVAAYIPSLPDTEKAECMEDAAAWSALECTEYVEERSDIELLISLSDVCVYRKGCKRRMYCPNLSHLQNCSHMYCNKGFKCISSYCIARDYVCDGECDCPRCEEESICRKLSCPGMILIDRANERRKCILPNDLANTVIYNRVLYWFETYSDTFPVYVDCMHYCKHIDMSKKFMVPELVTYVSMNYNFDRHLELPRMHNLRYLRLDECGLKSFQSYDLGYKPQLILLDLSYNSIATLSNSLLCPVNNSLKYLFLQENHIKHLDPNFFTSSLQLEVVVLYNNSIELQSPFNEPLPSLSYLWSDMARLCCFFKIRETCIPKFPRWMSCDSMINSLSLEIIAWILGIIISCLNWTCLIVMLKTLIQSNFRKANCLLLICLCVCIADLIAASCFTSLSVINVYYKGSFGQVADIWRHSLGCMALESFFFISSEASLVFGTYLSVKLAVTIPAMVKISTNRKHSCVQVLAIWLLIITAGIAKQIIMRHEEIDPYNYFCLPFLTLKPQTFLSLALQVSLIVVNSFLCLVSVVGYFILLAYSIKMKNKKGLGASKGRIIALQRFAARNAVVIISTIVTWIPTLIIQTLLVTNISISPGVVLYVVFSSFSANLIIDPILIIRSVSKQ